MRFLRRLLGLVLAVAVLLALPVGYVELACVGEPVEDGYAPIVTDPAERRAESRTLLTYPEWHIVYAYDDYAAVIAEGDPHDFGYLRAVRGFWSSLCALSEAASAYGGVGSEAKAVNYVIGVSFTLEMALKAAYEETLGRVATWVRGDERADLDELSATQAAAYADFLRQVPWYRWDFVSDAKALWNAEAGGFRNWERRLALGAEYMAKAGYARAIGAAAAAQGLDELTMRVVVTGLDAEALAREDGVRVIAEHERGIEIETPRYREFTRLAVRLAGKGADFVEIAGNDDIMLTALSGAEQAGGSVYSARRQGRDDVRHLIVLPVAELGDRLRGFGNGALRLEHIHDY